MPEIGDTRKTEDGKVEELMTIKETENGAEVRVWQTK